LAYRFTFNGKENDSETYGDGNAYDFGARIYDARLGRWLSVDPLNSKYPSLTPYHFTANNPIIYKDVDGKDYELVIDHKAKTITVVATYYVAEGNAKDMAAATAATAVWNSASGVFEYKAGGVNYKIDFNLTVKEAKDPIAAANADASGNSFAINDAEVKRNEDPGETDKGITRDGKHIAVKSFRAEETDPHEVGHTLGLGHFYKGFMGGYASRLKTSMKVTLGYVQEILRDNGLGSKPDVLNGEEERDADSKAKIKITFINGKTPEKLRNGDVERTDGNSNYIDY